MDQSTKSMLTDFFADYAVRSIGIAQDANIHKDAVSRVDIAFAKDMADPTQDYGVSFKLLEQASDIHRYLQGINAGPEHQVSLTEQGQGLGMEEVAGKLRQFIAAVGPRVAKIYKEQSILNTQPVGKVFMLHNKTRFKVLSEDGAGQLTIELAGSDGSRQAKMGVNDLLDGLYVGLIDYA